MSEENYLRYFEKPGSIREEEFMAVPNRPLTTIPCTEIPLVDKISTRSEDKGHPQNDQGTQGIP